MAEIFLCPRGAIKQTTQKRLTEAGVIVVEVPKPERCQFLRAQTLVSGDDLLWAVLKALQTGRGSSYSDNGSSQRASLANILFELISARRPKTAPVDGSPAEEPSCA